VDEARRDFRGLRFSFESWSLIRVNPRKSADTILLFLGEPAVMTTKAFWNRVKKLIKAHKITQKQFAEYLNIPLGSLQGMIHHERMPVLDFALDMATVLGVSVEYLANGKDKEAADRRRKELADRQSAIQISKLTAQIQKEAEKIQSKSKTAL